MSPMTESAASAAFIPTYVDYSASSLRPEFAADTSGPGPLEGRGKTGRLHLRYDPVEFDFRAEVLDALVGAGLLGDAERRSLDGSLEALHECIAAEHQVQDESQQSAAARVLYEMPDRFGSLHRRFVAEVVAPALGLGPVHLQQVPTFRVFFPGGVGYPGETTYHTDLMIGHNPRIVNLFVPLVHCEASRSLLMASLEDSLEFLAAYRLDYARFGRDTQLQRDTQARCAEICKPLETEVGEVVAFDPRCLHAGPANQTPLTRVTFDTRILPAAAAARQGNRYRGLGRLRAEFHPGAYFSAEPVGPLGV